MANPEKMLTLPLRRFMEYYVSTLDSRPIEYEDALVIDAIDKDKSFAHVQFEDLDTGKKLDRPRLWNINDWRSDYKVHLFKKRQSTIRYLKSETEKDNIKLVANKLVELGCIDYDPAVKKAVSIIKENNPKAFKNLGITLAVFDESTVP